MQRGVQWLLLAFAFAGMSGPSLRAAAQMNAAPAAPQIATGLVPAAQLEKLLPATVFFQQQSAPLQLRNAAAYRGASGNIVWASLVDTSGYSTGVRERYQFYFVTESATSIAGKALPAGAYGGGFLSDGNLLIMDIGGHDIFRVKVSEDGALRRPRPLQMTVDPAGVRLYLGRQYVSIAAK